MAIGTAGAIIGGAVIGGVASSSAASKQAKAQSKASGAAIAEQRRQFDITQQNLQPFTQTGADALNQQRILLGLGALPEQVQPNAQLQQGVALQAGLRDAESRLQGTRTGIIGRVLGKVAQGQQGGIDALQTEANQAQAAANQSNVALGTPAEQQAAAFAAFGESPGQKFLRDRAQKNLLRNQAAIGGLGGGNVRSALVEQGVGFAQQDFQNQFARLGQLAGQGQAATTNVGQFGQATAGNISNLLQAQGQARASGIAGQNAAFQQGLAGIGSGLGVAFGQTQPPQTGGTGSAISQGAFNQGANVDFSQFGFSDPSLKDNVEKMYEQGGFNVYRWDWNELAADLGLIGKGFGVMANEIKAVMPEAIIDRAGFMMVNYDMVGVNHG